MVENKNATSNGATQTDDQAFQSVSEILRDGRLLKDQELKDVAVVLRIRLPFLEAIEAGKYMELPGTTYAIGFVRSYADYLNLDSDKLVEQFKQEAEELERQIELHFPEPLPGGRVPSGAIFFVCIFLAVVFYGAWLLVSSSGKPVEDVVSDLPANLAEMIGIDLASQKEGREVSKTTATQEEASQIEKPVEEIAKNASEETGKTTQIIVDEGVAEKVPEAIEVEQDIEQNTFSDATLNANEEGIGAIGANEETASASDNALSDNMATENILNSNEGAGETAPDISTDTAVSTNIEYPPAVEILTLPDNEPVFQEITTPSDAEDNIGNDAVDTRNNLDDVAQTDVMAIDPIPSPPSLPYVERTPTVYGEENTDARVIITANTITWVEITSPSGELLLTRLLGENDSYRVPNIPGLTLVTGNAGGLDFTVDGQVVPNIGPVGSIRRDVSLDAESLKLGTDQ